MLESIDGKFGAKVVSQRPTDDFARAEVDHDSKVEPTGRRGDVGDVASPDLIWFLGKRLVNKQVGRGFVCPSITGSRHECFGLNGPQLPISHDSSHSIRGANDALIVKLLPDPPVSITATMMSEYHLNQIPDLLIRLLRWCGLGSVVIAAARNAQRITNGADTMAGGLANFLDHFAELCWGLEPRIIAAFFKMSFSCRRRAFSRRRARRSSAPDPSPTARCPTLPT